jgi:hypothetical protein
VTGTHQAGSSYILLVGTTKEEEDYYVPLLVASTPCSAWEVLELELGLELVYPSLASAPSKLLTVLATGAYFVSLTIPCPSSASMVDSQNLHATRLVVGEVCSSTNNTLPAPSLTISSGVNLCRTDSVL